MNQNGLRHNSDSGSNGTSSQDGHSSTDESRESSIAVASTSIFQLYDPESFDLLLAVPQENFENLLGPPNEAFEVDGRVINKNFLRTRFHPQDLPLLTSSLKDNKCRQIDFDQAKGQEAW